MRHNMYVTSILPTRDPTRFRIFDPDDSFPNEVPVWLAGNWVEYPDVKLPYLREQEFKSFTGRDPRSLNEVLNDSTALTLNLTGNISDFDKRFPEITYDRDMLSSVRYDLALAMMQPGAGTNTRLKKLAQAKHKQLEELLDAMTRYQFEPCEPSNKIAFAISLLEGSAAASSCKVDTRYGVDFASKEDYAVALIYLDKRLIGIFRFGTDRKITECGTSWLMKGVPGAFEVPQVYIIQTFEIISNHEELVTELRRFLLLDRKRRAV